MATICDVNWASGCGAMDGLFNQIKCWVGCNPLFALLIMVGIGGVIYHLNK